jgi:hypothetical protein
MTTTQVETKLRRLLADADWHDARDVKRAVRKGGEHMRGYQITEAVRHIGGMVRSTYAPSFQSGEMVVGWLDESTTEYRLPS